MGKLNETKEHLLNIKINKSWQYLCYIYLALPLLIFVLAVITKDGSMGPVFGVMFHNYGLFAISPIPNLSSFTGVVGLLLAIWFLFDTIRRRDWWDLAISASLVALCAAYFLQGVNYMLLDFIRIQ